MTINIIVSKVRRFLLGINIKGYEVSELIATKVELNPRMLSTLKNAKSILSMNPGANFETSVVGLLGILVALVKRQIGRGSSNSRRFSGRTSMGFFFSFVLY